MNSKERILKYLEMKGISKREFYHATGLSNGFLDKTNNISADKLEKIISIYKDLNLHYIVTGKGSVIEDKKMVSNLVPNLVSNPEKLGSNPGSNNTNSGKILNDPTVQYIPVPVDKHGNENIIFVDLKAAAGFGAIVNNEKLLSEYPSIALPGFLYRGRKQYVAFETDGDSMHPTLQHKDIVITSRIEKITDIKNGYVHTIVCGGVITTKRLHYIAGDNYIECISDNDDVYEAYKQPLDEVTAIFKGEALVRTQFRNWNNDLRKDISILKRDMDRIKRKLDI